MNRSKSCIIATPNEGSDEHLLPYISCLCFWLFYFILSAHTTSSVRSFLCYKPAAIYSMRCSISSVIPRQRLFGLFSSCHRLGLRRMRSQITPLKFLLHTSFVRFSLGVLDRRAFSSATTDGIGLDLGTLELAYTPLMLESKNLIGPTR